MFSFYRLVKELEIPKDLKESINRAKDQMKSGNFLDYKNVFKERKISELLSTVPIDLNQIDPEDLDKEILRVSIISELDAINLYEQMANMTDNDNVRDVLLSVAKEEKTHIGEFQSVLEDLDSEHEDELEAGEEEVETKL